jgi:hypothetical protein
MPTQLCPIHKRPFVRGICGPCRIESRRKAAQAPVPKSAAALRAERWREEQKQQNPDFNKKEAKRKHNQRKQLKQNPEAFSKDNPEFPLDLRQLRQREDRSGVFMAGAPRGSGKLVPTGNPQNVFINRIRQALVAQGPPTRAQLSDDELRKTLSNAALDLQQKTEIILKQWSHDREFCDWLQELSLDDLSQFIEECADNLEYVRHQLYENTEHNQLTNDRNTGDEKKLLTHAGPHARRVAPGGHSPDVDIKDNGEEQDDTFARKINFKKSDIEVLRIGNRNVRFYNLQNDTPEQHFENFIRTCTGGTSDACGCTICSTIPPTKRYSNIWQSTRGKLNLLKPMMCELCQQQIAAEAALDHFAAEHRQEVIEHIRWWEAKAWRPKPRVRCNLDHGRLTKKYGSGPDKLYCRRCGKLLYKPARPKRSDIEKKIIDDTPIAA